MTNSGVSAAKRPDGRPIGTTFKPGQFGNSAGRPKGILSLETRVRAILEGDTPLQQAIADCIRAQCGEDKHGLDAVLIVGLGAKPSCATDRAFS